MLTRIALAFSTLALAVVAAQAGAPANQAQPAAEAPKADIVQVALDTEKGRILLALDRGKAPVTVANFLRYVDAKRFDGINFYRAMPYGGGDGLIQAGITKDAKLLYPPIAHEPASITGLTHEAGSLMMANLGPGTARADFFITLGPIPAFGDSFALFGKVVEGMDVVKTILAAPVDPEKGAGPMKGQMLTPAIAIRSARRVTSP